MNIEGLCMILGIGSMLIVMPVLGLISGKLKVKRSKMDYKTIHQIIYELITK